MTLHIVAVGQDVYWLTAVEKAIAGWAGKPDMLECPKELSECVSALPAPDANAVLLVDASGQNDMECTVALLRSRGWKYVIVVAADPSAKEAISILRRNLGYDYWEKTYDEEEIRSRVKASFEEIRADREWKKRNRLKLESARRNFE